MYIPTNIIYILYVYYNGISYVLGTIRRRRNVLEWWGNVYLTRQCMPTVLRADDLLPPPPLTQATGDETCTRLTGMKMTKYLCYHTCLRLRDTGRYWHRSVLSDSIQYNVHRCQVES